MTARAVFLDRDGTLNVECDFLADPDRLVLLPGAADAVRALDAAGYSIVVITNQSGIARGYLDEATLARIHARLHEALDRLPRAYLHCPHLQDARGPYARQCDCRKPATGLIADAVHWFGLQLEGSFVIGDSARDVLAVATLPALRSVLVQSGKPWRAQADELARRGVIPDFVAADLRAAAAWILENPHA